MWCGGVVVWCGLFNYFFGCFARVRTKSFDRFNQIITLRHLTKHGVFSVQPFSDDCRNEELRAVRVRTGIRHTQQTRFGVFQSEVFISEFRAVNRFLFVICQDTNPQTTNEHISHSHIRQSVNGVVTYTARSVVVSEVTALEHELRDNAVEATSFVSVSLLSRA